jgi:hypothetical protein
VEAIFGQRSCEPRRCTSDEMLLVSRKFPFANGARRPVQHFFFIAKSELTTQSLPHNFNVMEYLLCSVDNMQPVITYSPVDQRQTRRVLFRLVAFRASAQDADDDDSPMTARNAARGSPSISKISRRLGA